MENEITKEVALRILIRHNEWRKGKDTPLIKPKMISSAIEKAIEVIKLSIDNYDFTTKIIEQNTNETIRSYIGFYNFNRDDGVIIGNRFFSVCGSNLDIDKKTLYIHCEEEK